MKLYGSVLCPDCVDAFDILKEKNIDYDYVDINESMKTLKEFLKLRDNRDEFKEVRENSNVGIPCFLFDDGSITFDVDKIVK